MKAALQYIAAACGKKLLIVECMDPRVEAGFELPRRYRPPQHAYTIIPSFFSDRNSSAGHIDLAEHNNLCNIIYEGQEWAYDQRLSIASYPQDKVERDGSQKDENMPTIYSPISQALVVAGTA